MRKGLLIALVLAAVLLAGCDGRLLVNLDIPIVVEPAPPRYQGEAWGYLVVDPVTKYIQLLDRRPVFTSRRQPLENAEVTVVGTGLTVRTDRDGYFFVRGVPFGKIEIRVKHHSYGPRSGVYLTTRGR